MIKLQQAGSYHNFRCGEVLCVGPATYHVCCSLCGQTISYDSFTQHFRLEHLTQAEDGKLLDVQPEQEEHVDELGQLVVKVEDDHDPIAHETHEADVDLAQIALLDQEHEQVEPTEATTTRKRRAVALQNALVPAEVGQEVDEAWADSEVHEMMLHNYADNDEDYNYNDDDGEEEDDDDSANEVDDAKDMLFQCDQCDRAYNTKRSLQGHKRSKHSANRSDSCNAEADANTSTDLASSSSRSKRRTKGPAKVYKCNECELTFRTERDLRGHRWKHTGIFCDICGKPFTQSGNMMRHRQRHSGIKPHKCQECDATFYTQKELTSHNICHTGRMPCICEICGRPCRDRGVLTAHMRRHTGERPAKCDVCGKAFYSFHDLNVHAVSHTSLRPFVCDVCGSTFQRKKALRVHKLLHSEQRKYACKLCSKTFAQSGGLNAHMRTHEARAKAKGSSATTAGSAPAPPPNEHEVTISVAVEPAVWHVQQ